MIVLETENKELAEALKANDIDYKVGKPTEDDVFVTSLKAIKDYKLTLGGGSRGDVGKGDKDPPNAKLVCSFPEDGLSVAVAPMGAFHVSQVITKDILIHMLKMGR